jgi:hypothetical protein
MSDNDLPQEAKEARICIYECTFCAERVDIVLENVPELRRGFPAASDPAQNRPQARR